MSTTIARLVTLQEHDRRAVRLEKESEDVPARSAHIEASIQKEKDAVAEAQDRLNHQLSAAKQVELDVESSKERIATLRNQQFQVKSNDDYRTLEREIATVEEGIRKLEDSEIEIMERMEEAKSFINEKESELKRGEAQVTVHLDSLNKRLADIKVEMKQLEVERTSLLEGIDPDWLARYERLLAHTGDYALVAVHNGGCGRCHMKLPPQVSHDARKGDSIVSCPYCGRMLYCQS